MNLRRATQISILLLAMPLLACSMLRATQPLNWHLTLEIDPSVQNLQAATNQAVTTLESRLNAFGVSKFEVKALGTPPSGRILVSLPNVSDRERLKKLLSTEGRLELSPVISPSSPVPIRAYASKEEALTSLGGTLPPDRRVLPYTEVGGKTVGGGSGQRWVIVDANAIVDDNDVRSAQAIPNRPGLENYSILFSLRATGAEKFSKWTGANINQYLAVIYDGEVKSIVYIRTQILDQGEISGQFTKQAADDIALILKSGALPKVKIVEEG